jgi:hypothetical protein
LSRQIKWTTDITYKAAHNIILAARFSASRRPLNRLLTINNLTDRSDRPQPVVTKYLKYIGDWLRYGRTPLQALWVLEREPATNVHVHILLHIPSALTRSFNRHCREWLRLSGVSWTPKVIHSEPVFDLMGLVAYILKGTEEAACRALSTELPIPITHRPQGPIIGKRCGTSQSIGAAARLGKAASPRWRAAA